MAMVRQHKVLYDFGVFRLDPVERLLLCNGEAVPLTPRNFDTLLLLVENSGHMLRKDELIEKLWPDSFVGENSLAQNISALRRALDEGSGGQQYIETLPRLGYRFTAAVTKVEQEAMDGVREHPTKRDVVWDMTGERIEGLAQAADLSDVVDSEEQTTDVPTYDESSTDRAESSTPAVPATAVIADIGRLSTPTEVSSWGSRRRLAIGLIALSLIVFVAVGYALLVSRSHSGTSKQPLRLAVLPFRNLKQDPETDFLAFSLADAVITKLGYVNTLIVRPSAYIDKYRNQAIDPGQVASELKVDLLLTGSFIKEGDNLRIMTQLVDVGRNEIVWRDTIDLKYDKLLTVQDQVTAQVIRGLQLNLSPAETKNLTLDAPANALAYEYYLRGVDLYSQNNFSMAISMLEKTVGLDPNYAQAWAQLGRAYNAEAAFDLKGHDAYEKAFAAYERALSLSPHQVEPRIFMANTYTDTGRVQQAIPLLRETLEAHPNQAEAHWELGYAYRFGGMLHESINECERARQLDPQVKINNSAINAYVYAGDYAKFLESLPPTEDVAYIIFYRGFGNYYLKNWARAASDFDLAYQRDPSLYSQVGAALSRSLAGHNDEGLVVLRDLENKIQQRKVRDAEAIYKVAQVYAVMGDKVSALRVLRRSIEGGFFCYPYFVSDPLLEPLRGESEYAALMELARKRHEEFKREFFTSSERAE
jgi:DNA-binding winged helix-turn-helix (wHTH) protein/TolB-like protein/Flp pilus assembly protein TadD